MVRIPRRRTVLSAVALAILIVAGLAGAGLAADPAAAAAAPSQADSAARGWLEFGLTIVAFLLAHRTLMARTIEDVRSVVADVAQLRAELSAAEPLGPSPPTAHELIALRKEGLVSRVQAEAHVARLLPPPPARPDEVTP